MNLFQTWVAKTEMPCTLLMSWQTLRELDDDSGGGGGGEQAAKQTGLEKG